MIVNDLAKDIEVAEEIRSACQIKKIINLMIVPISANVSNNGGSMLLLLNRYSSAEAEAGSDAHKYINFNAYTLLVSNKLFQYLLAYCKDNVQLIH